MLARHVGLAEGRGLLRRRGRGCRELIADGSGDRSGHPVYDGSGLSRENRLAAETLLDVLRWRPASDDEPRAAQRAHRPAGGRLHRLAGVPVRRGTPGRAGLVRAKTGTLTGVGSLAGTVTDQDGTLMVVADGRPGPRAATPSTPGGARGRRRGPRRLPLLGLLTH